MKIYEIPDEIRKAWDAIMDTVDEDTGEITDEVLYDLLKEKVEKLEIEFKERIQGLCLLRLETLSDVETIDKEIRRMQGIKARAERKADSLKEYVEILLKGEKFKTPFVSVYYGRSKSVDVTNEKALPDDYVEVELKPKKDEIKKALAEGKKVPGAQLKETDYTVIRYPQPKEGK